MRCATRTYAKRGAYILFFIGMFMIGYASELSAILQFIFACVRVTAWIDCEDDDVNGQYESDDFHNSNVNEKIVQ